MAPITERYRDLLAEDGDAPMERLVADLDRAYATATPPRLRAALRDELVRRASGRQPERPRLARVGPWRRRPVIAAVALLAAAVITGGAYAYYTSLIGQAYQWAPSLGSAMNRYAHPVHNASASVCGYTLTVVQAYADANQVTVGYTLGGPAKRHFVSMESDWPLLSDTRHTPFKHLDLGMSTTMLNGAAGHFASFDASHVAANARSLSLALTLPQVDMTEEMEGAQPASAPCETYRTWVSGITVGHYSGPARTVTVNRPLTVRFTVPVDAAKRVAELHQTVAAGGTALTLQRVVVTRSEVRLYLKRATRGHILEGAANAMLYLGKHAYGGAAPLFADWWVRDAPASRLYDFWIEAPAYSYHGVWTLVVPKDINGWGWRKLTGGPWVFRFRVP